MPLRLAILGDSPCDLCTAACCRQNGHDYAVLLEGERERRKFAAFAVDVPVGRGGFTSVERVLPYHAGRCRFLGEDERCTIYDDRPANCRRFQCVSGFHHGGGDVGGHGGFLQRNPAVLEMLASLRATGPGSPPAPAAVQGVSQKGLTRHEPAEGGGGSGNRKTAEPIDTRRSY
jgi:Fe-S-cluster containining protein